MRNKKKVSVPFFEGFTLVELLVVIAIIGILAAGATLAVTNVVNRNRFDITTKRIENLQNAIIGNPTLITNNVRTDFGYVGDMGRLPASLLELTTQGAQPAWNSTTQCGWHGPYIRSPFQEDASAYSRDGWGNNFSYNNTTGVITSTGSDGATGGSDWASDINSEAINGLITNSVTVKVFDGKGNSATNARITVYYPDPATSIEINTYHDLILSDNGMYTFNSIPTGMRKIIVTFSGETYIKWVAIVPTTTVSADFKIVKSPTTPNAPIGLTTIPYSTTQINLSWTAPTQNTDGTTLSDLVSYNLYRGISTGTETFLINIGNKNISFADTNLREAENYYYKISALNSGSNESAQSTEANAKASPIQQRAALNPVFNTLSQYWRIPIQNYWQDTITISSMQISWTYGVGGAEDLTTVQIGPNGGWTTVWTSADGVLSPTGILNFSPTYSLPSGVINREVRLGFADTIRITSLTLRFNTSDGYIIVVNNP